MRPYDVAQTIALDHSKQICVLGGEETNQIPAWSHGLHQLT